MTYMTCSLCDFGNDIDIEISSISVSSVVSRHDVNSLAVQTLSLCPSEWRLRPVAAMPPAGYEQKILTLSLLARSKYPRDQVVSYFKS
jgi:hypothetical protein